jgi:hypothetical protein
MLGNQALPQYFLSNLCNQAGRPVSISETVRHYTDDQAFARRPVDSDVGLGAWSRTTMLHDWDAIHVA